MVSTSVPNRGAATLESELELCQEQARIALARAAAVDPATDEYGQAATNANADALRFLKMSTKIGLALAKLKGEHTNNINVRRTEIVEQPPAPVRRTPFVPLVPPPPDPEREARVQKIYDDWVAENAARKARGEDDEDEDEGFEDEDAGEEQVEEEGVSAHAGTGQEGDPPLISEGSNGEK